MGSPLAQALGGDRIANFEPENSAFFELAKTSHSYINGCICMCVYITIYLQLAMFIILHLGFSVLKCKKARIIF